MAGEVFSHGEKYKKMVVKYYKKTGENELGNRVLPVESAGSTPFRKFICTQRLFSTRYNMSSL